MLLFICLFILIGMVYKAKFEQIETGRPIDNKK